MTVEELIAQLQECPARAQVELDMPASFGADSRPCQGVGAQSRTRVILWALTAAEEEE